MGKRRGKKSEPAAADAGDKKRKKKKQPEPHGAAAEVSAEAAARRGPSLKKTKGDQRSGKSRRRATYGGQPMQYGVLKGRAIKGKRAHKHDAHYLLTVRAERDGDAATTWRVPIDVRSVEKSLLLFFVDGDVTAQAPDRAELAGRWTKKLEALAALGVGWTPLGEDGGGVALDYVREGYAHADEMSQLGADGPGADDVHDEVHLWIHRAIEQKAEVHVFGSRFAAAKAHGVHDVHLNQGNAGDWEQDNGAHRDGGLVLRFGSGKTAVLLFAFASQSRDVDEHGHPR